MSHATRASVKSWLVAHRAGLIVVLLVGLVYAWMYGSQAGNGQPESDGHYTWLFARSLVFDHDLDFKNDYALCGDPHGKNVLRGTAHPDNPFYIGPSLVWAPLLFGARHWVHLPANAPAAELEGCNGRLPALVLFAGPLAGALALWFSYLAARRFAGDGCAALAALLFGTASSLPAYASIYPSFSHAYDALATALLLLASLRARERPRDLLRWGVAGLAAAVLLLMRPVSGAFVLVPLALAAAELHRDRLALARALSALGAPIVLFGVVPQALIYRYLYGKLWAGAPHGKYYMQWGHAHPWLSLFSPHGGLFYSTPVFWLAVLGAGVALARRESRLLAAALVASTALLVWVSSAALDWDSSGTFGSRRMTSLVAPAVLVTAVLLERIAEHLRARPRRALLALGVATAAPLAAATLGAVVGIREGRSSLGSTTEEQLFGGGFARFFQQLDKSFDPAVLPAELYWRARYGLPMSSMREGVEATYIRNYRTMAFLVRDLPFAKEGRRSLTKGLAPDARGMRIVAPRATMVFAAQWPVATKVVVTASSTRAETVRVGRGLWFGRTEWFGSFTTPATATSRASYSVEIPKGAFESGIVELVFATDGPADGSTVLENVHLDDETAWPPAL